MAEKSPEGLAVYHAALKVLKVGGIGDGAARCKSDPKVRVCYLDNSMQNASSFFFIFSSLCHSEWDFFFFIPQFLLLNLVWIQSEVVGVSCFLSALLSVSSPSTPAT